MWFDEFLCYGLLILKGPCQVHQFPYYYIFKLCLVIILRTSNFWCSIWIWCIFFLKDYRAITLKSWGQKLLKSQGYLTKSYHMTNFKNVWKTHQTSNKTLSNDKFKNFCGKLVKSLGVISNYWKIIVSQKISQNRRFLKKLGTYIT